MPRLYSGLCKGFAVPHNPRGCDLRGGAVCRTWKTVQDLAVVAMWRAIGSRNPDAEMRNPDYLAGRFLGAQERSLMSGTSTLPCLEYELRGSDAVSSERGRNCILLQHSREDERHIDEALCAGQSRVGQRRS